MITLLYKYFCYEAIISESHNKSLKFDWSLIRLLSEYISASLCHPVCLSISISLYSYRGIDLIDYALWIFSHLSPAQILYNLVYKLISLDLKWLLTTESKIRQSGPHPLTKEKLWRFFPAYENIFCSNYHLTMYKLECACAFSKIESAN